MITRHTIVDSSCTGHRVDPRRGCRRIAAPLVGLILIAASGWLCGSAVAQQPRVTAGPQEPDWVVILRSMYGLDLRDDLANPVTDGVDDVPGRFRRVGEGPVIYRPVIALGLETRTRGGFYQRDEDGAVTAREPLWSYVFKNAGRDLERNENLPPPLEDGSQVQFDPGDKPFGLWVSNDGLDEGEGAYSEPAVVRERNERLSKQPYKVMIYPLRDRETGQTVPNAYLLGWEYSTNDDFQDVVCIIENVELVP